MALPSGSTYILKFRPDVKPYQCLIRGCTSTAEIVPKTQRSQAWRLPSRKPDDLTMGQAEWELWAAEGMKSYCVFHKCDVEGCNRGLKFDERDQVSNMCGDHCHSYTKKKASEEGKRRSSVTRIVGSVFSSSTSKPEVKVQGVLPRVETGPGKLARRPEVCSDRACERLQIVDATGSVGYCEIHTMYPVLPDSSAVEPGGPVPPFAVRMGVNIAGQITAGGESLSAVAGALTITNGVVSVVSILSGA